MIAWLKVNANKQLILSSNTVSHIHRFCHFVNLHMTHICEPYACICVYSHVCLSMQCCLHLPPLTVIFMPSPSKHNPWLFSLRRLTTRQSCYTRLSYLLHLLVTFYRATMKWRSKVYLLFAVLSRFAHYSLPFPICRQKSIFSKPNVLMNAVGSFIQCVVVVVVKLFSCCPNTKKLELLHPISWVPFALLCALLSLVVVIRYSCCC